ncbi:hypothetical protein L211DRAFT_670417 [Terfezia boudieri ATCC MYA-4762]|uniref:Helicase ATP-binding domain-containing protein n=1 Tax=Terfezia boudieri ATCC MYA-4762 TaxID=1051890 RepID=A0A3N4LBZ3_9PEZI|nr:hypothetical protein L211DRAFT_670417 [Terfezia boudieri ATCC MYA-4762]
MANFRSQEQKDCLVRVVQADPSPLLIVLPIGAEKSILFLPPSSLLQARVTAVIVPYVALKSDLVARAKAARQPYVLFTPAFREAVPLVFASAERQQENGGLLHYLQLMAEQGQLQRIVIDECHVESGEGLRAKDQLSTFNALLQSKCPMFWRLDDIWGTWPMQLQWF